MVKLYISAQIGKTCVAGAVYYDEQVGKPYLCTETIVIKKMPHELVGQYFELYEVE